MRIQIKGGVWKNTEDEILKAAVMKYGLNQWSRISSLLVRKSAKQCKARWYEWLDPAIKKTEWTREEDEKLLHLGKLMPTQWRTIAPIVGRTPAQCLDRYDRLLDMAVNKEDKYDAADDPRRLRPGEIDPNPESKPARPDAIDMDEEEKEMLSEARARLANTRGKKAKRKARERQMEEARRLASLQKKRELKAAGIEISTKEKSKRTIDYSAEVAFEHKPAPGFFDVSEEQATTKALQAEFRPVTLQELEGKRRRDLEDQMIKQEMKRQKVHEAHNMPDAVQQAAALNDPTMIRRKGRMMLPAPQVSEAELEAIAKMSTEAMMDAAVTDEGAGGEATRELLGQYGPTPMRAPPPPPRTQAAGDRIMQEAENLAKLQNLATPLIGGDNPDLNPSDFSGITPRNVVAQTPNPLLAAATPIAGGMSVRRTFPGSTPAIAGVASTPGRGGMAGLPGATPLQTPIRDQLGLNDTDMLASMGAVLGKRAEAARLAALRSELRAGLGSLPAPEHEYQVVVPETAMDVDDEAGEVLEEDAAEAKARRQKEEEERRRLEELKKSKALQRGLPRPASLAQLPAPHPASEQHKLSLRELAEDALIEELGVLLRYDAARYPLPPVGVKPDSKEARKAAKAAALAAASVPPLEELSQAELANAAALLEAEAAHVRRAMGHGDKQPEEYLEAQVNASKELMWVPSKGAFTRVASATSAERVESLKHEYEQARAEMEAEARRASKLEQKVGLLLAGLQQRDVKLRKQVEEGWENLQQSNRELQCFQALHEHEQQMAPERIEGLLDLLQRQQDREKALQDRFKGLMREKEELQERLAAATAVTAA